MTAMATTRNDSSDFAAISAQLQSGQSLASFSSSSSLDLTQRRYDTASGALTSKLNRTVKVLPTPIPPTRVYANG